MANKKKQECETINFLAKENEEIQTQTHCYKDQLITEILFFEKENGNLRISRKIEVIQKVKL
jgi:hypothetical protein